ncbi:MAG TPA: SDR family oxidoreductase [Candidatus Binatia bacterium]|nr:SDR family oxidoreductase [Candidatus Binatia bacterium]
MCRLRRRHRSTCGGGTGRAPATPQEIADAIVYLTSDNASFVHGAVLPLDGGRTAV